MIVPPSYWKPINGTALALEVRRKDCCLSRANAHMQELKMGARRPRRRQSRCEYGGDAVATGCWNENRPHQPSLKTTFSDNGFGQTLTWINRQSSPMHGADFSLLASR